MSAPHADLSSVAGVQLRMTQGAMHRSTAGSVAQLGHGTVLDAQEALLDGVDARSMSGAYSVAGSMSTLQSLLASQSGAPTIGMRAAPSLLRGLSIAMEQQLVALCLEELHELLCMPSH